MKIPALDIGDIHVPFPLIQGGMGVRVSLARLAAAVANEGGIGTIAAVGLGDIEASKTDFENVSLAKAIAHRESRRKYTSEALKLEELSFLLWATQGVNSVDQNRVWTKRTVPSAGARHPFETYLIINRVDGVEPGVYRYLPLEHKLLLVSNERPLPAKISEACWGQAFVGQSAVVFVWAAIPYRAEWRYSVIAYKGIAVDMGHICQNLYLACEAVGAGTCAILAYDQTAIDALIGVDGEEEFVVYLAPVGKI